MKAVIRSARLHGSVAAIPSKSQAHRLLICAALSGDKTEIFCPDVSEDILATAACLRALGAEIDYENGLFSVCPIKQPVPNAELDCGESGSTLRFLLPVVCALGAGAKIKMHGRLPRRPLSPLWEELESSGAGLSRPAEDTICVSCKIKKAEFQIPGNVSSQYISGLLLALPLLGGGSVSVSGELESAGYVDMTARAMSAFGVCPEKHGGSYVLHEGSYISPGSVRVEGDWSNGAFWLVAASLVPEKLECRGLDPASAQGDRAVMRVIAEIRRANAVIDCSQIPDLVPVLAVLAALTPGKTEFINAARLRLKESDRISSSCEMLTELGAEAEERPEGLVVNGKSCLSGGKTDSRGDHRIAMAAAIAAVGCTGSVEISNASAVNKSYPAFWRDYAALGGDVSLEEE